MNSNGTYITNWQNNKKIYFRKQLLPFLLIIVLMGLAVLSYIRELGLTVKELRYYQEQQSKTTDKLVVMFKSERDTAEIEVTQKQKEIDQKSDELNKVSTDLAKKEIELTAKIQELKSKENEIATLQKKISNQESQLASNSAELNQLRSRPPLFSFNNESSLADFENKKAQVKDVVTSAYDVIAEIYGQPYLLHSVTITFVDNFSINGASGEIKITNSAQGLAIDIRLKDFNKNDFDDVSAIIHEIIHSFHGVAVFETTVYEEGMTVAATDVVLAHLISDKKISDFGYLYLVISQATYDSYNSTLNIPTDSTAFYDSPDVSQYYQMAGLAWSKLYQANPNFFKEFNNEYYSHIQNGESGDNNLVQSIIKNKISTVAGQPIDNFLVSQKVFNPN